MTAAVFGLFRDGGNLDVGVPGPYLTAIRVECLDDF